MGAAAIAVALADRGARLLVAGRDADRGNAVVAQICAAGGQADFLHADLAEAASAKDLGARAMKAAGGTVDILVNNAGIGSIGATPGFPEEDVDAIAGDQREGTVLPRR